jgi:GGDEF domain-containing protein
MELLLWRWSVGVQGTSLALILVFFAVLARTLRFPELTSWAQAWAANFIALGVTFLYWNWRTSDEHFPVLAGVYMAAKTAFALLLILGALQLRRPGATLVSKKTLLGFAAVYGAAGLLVPTIDVVGIIQNLVLGTLFGFGSTRLLRAPREGGTTWLGAAMLLRCILHVVVAGVFLVTATSIAAGSPAVVAAARQIASAHSSIDGGAEWLLALASVLALSDRMSRQLRKYNQDLLAAQEDLRRLVDRDPLTALSNRRSLPEVFRTVQPQGALVLFFDLDDFKGVNDRFGHPVGDLCLKRFAQQLRESFRPSDALLRYAGDEFLVVASGLDPGAAWERVERLREALVRESEEGLPYPSRWEWPSCRRVVGPRMPSRPPTARCTPQKAPAPRTDAEPHLPCDARETDRKRRSAAHPPPYPLARAARRRHLGDLGRDACGRWRAAT